MAVFLVTSANDSGAGSLRAAIAAANSTPGTDTIQFDDTLAGSTIDLTSGSILISDALDILGLGASDLTVDGGATVDPIAVTDRIFTIDDGDDTTAIAVSIADLTLSGGGIAGNGGAIVNSEDLTLERTVVTGSVARGIPDGDGGFDEGKGGGIYHGVAGTTLTLRDSQVANNLAYGDGGGIFVAAGEARILTSTIADNAGDSGGGLFVDNDGGAGADSDPLDSRRGKAFVVSSTVSGNVAFDGGGGGIFNKGYLDVTNATISSNTARASGGGIAATSIGIFGEPTVTSYLRNSTVTLNAAHALAPGQTDDRASDGRDFAGGGLFNERSFLGGNPNHSPAIGGPFTISNTIVAGNSDDFNRVDGANTIKPDGTRGDIPLIPDLFGVFEVEAGSSPSTIIGDTNGEDTALTLATTGEPLSNRVETFDTLSTELGTVVTLGDILDPTLADNGGATLTHQLVADSPAQDRGDSTLLPPDTFDLDGDSDTSEDLPLDQRSEVIYPQVVGGALDIGAFEVGTSIGPFTLLERVNLGAIAGDVDLVGSAGGDPDEGITYSIASNVDPDGDGTDAFAIDPSTGFISVNDAGDVDSVNLPNPNADNLLAIAVSADDGVATQTVDVGITIVNIASNILGGPTDTVVVGTTGTNFIRATTTDIGGPVGIRGDINDVNDSSTGAADNIQGTANAETIFAQGGDDIVSGGGANDTIAGGEGRDQLFGGSGSDRLSGESGDDLLFGGAGIDLLNGGFGDDLFIGGSSVDLLLGGPGNDIFEVDVATTGADVISDFTPGSDVLRIRDGSLNVNSFTYFYNGFTTSLLLGGLTRVTLNGNYTTEPDGVFNSDATTTLTAADFQFID